MDYILVYGISILVGLIAHYWKARNGIIWSFLTFALMLPLISFHMMGGVFACFHGGGRGRDNCRGLYGMFTGDKSLSFLQAADSRGCDGVFSL